MSDIHIYEVHYERERDAGDLSPPRAHMVRFHLPNPSALWEVCAQIEAKGFSIVQVNHERAMGPEDLFDHLKMLSIVDAVSK